MPPTISHNAREFSKKRHEHFFVHEHLIFSDMRFLSQGNSKKSPYHVLNLIPSHDGMNAAALLRIHWATHVTTERPLLGLNKSKADGYTGLPPSDELGALISLVLGVRIKVSPLTRSYKPNGDPSGIEVRHYSAPTSPVPPEQFTPVVSWANNNREIHLEKVNTLSNLDLIDEKQLGEIVKTAKLFSDALWICESDPRLSWILLVSALKTAASSEINSKDVRSISAFENYYSEISDILKGKLDEANYTRIANEFGKTQKARIKFLRFCRDFHPAPPDDTQRPSIGRVDWTEAGWQTKLSTIYNQRSEYLHSGKPLPFPLLQSPQSFPFYEGTEPSEKRALEEEFSALGAQWLGANFVSEDLPIYLNCFTEYVHGVLNRWLTSHLRSTTMGMHHSFPPFSREKAYVVDVLREHALSCVRVCTVWRYTWRKPGLKRWVKLRQLFNRDNLALHFGPNLWQGQADNAALPQL